VRWTDDFCTGTMLAVTSNCRSYKMTESCHNHMSPYTLRCHTTTHTSYHLQNVYLVPSCSGWIDEKRDLRYAIEYLLQLVRTSIEQPYHLENEIHHHIPTTTIDRGNRLGAHGHLLPLPWSSIPNIGRFGPCCGCISHSFGSCMRRSVQQLRMYIMYWNHLPPYPYLR
jgi:hypothetical protein